MNESKQWYLSKGVIGSVATMAAGVLGIWFTGIESVQIEVLLTSLGSFVGGLLSLIGRLKASKKIGKPNISDGTPVLFISMIFLLGACGTTASISRNPDNGEASLKWSSQKDYGSIKAHAEFDDQGRTKVFHFEAEDVKNAAAESQAKSFDGFINALERAYSKTPIAP